MSLAFEKSLDEVSRLRDAADRFDSEILQFVSVTTAGFVAGGAVLLQQIHVVVAQPLTVLATVVTGLSLLPASFACAVRAAIGPADTGAIDPRLLVQYPEFWRSDERFEQEAMHSVAEAFHEAIQDQARKWRWFRLSLGLMGLGVATLVLGVVLCVSTAAGGGHP